MATAGGTVETAGPVPEELEMLRVQLRVAEETAQRVQQEVLPTSNNTFHLLTSCRCDLTAGVTYPLPTLVAVRWC